MLGAVSVGWPGLLLQSLMNQLPYIRFHDDRKEGFMAIPFCLFQSLHLAILGFRSMVNKNPGIGLFCQHIFDTGIRPEIAIISGFMRSPHFSTTLFGPNLRRCLSAQLIEPAGNLFLSKAL